MFQLKPGALAIVIGAKTPAGRQNGDVASADGQHGFAWVRAEHLMPLSPDRQPGQAAARQSQLS
ncbi:hypothetical protein BXA16_13535 [Salmonella enterica subsp. enterica serovar Typhimurium]|nr:hypothetical protein BXA16_13535 [Salmonella enterica subsp. enterica serovar Typhimurium]